MSTDTDTLGPVAPAPREGCPAWCTDHYRNEDASGYVSEGHEARRNADDPACAGGKALVQVFQPVESTTVFLYIDARRAGDIGGAGDVAELMCILGHEAIAAAVDELAAAVAATA